MNFELCVLPIVLPVIFWAGYHYWHDRHLPEPAGNLALAFLLGAGSSYLALLMYQALELVNLRQDAYLLADTSLLQLFSYSILAIGFIEELSKMIPFLVVILHLKAFDEPIDGIIYASFLALGFTAVENLQYLTITTDIEAIARGFAAPVVHMVFASIWGFYIGRAYLCGKSLIGPILASLAVAATLHGAYDFVVIALPTPALPLAAALIVGIWIWRLRLIGDLHTLRPGPCPTDETSS